MNGWFGTAVRTTKRIVNDHGANIFAVLAGIGVVTTGVLAYNAGKKVILQDDGNEDDDRSSNKGVFLPPISAAAGTIGCIAASRYFGCKHEKSLAAALSVCTAYIARQRLEQPDSGDQTLNNGTVQKRNFRVERSEVEDTGTGDIIFRETFTGRAFKASMKAYKHAEQELQYMFSICGFVSLNDFYELLGVEESCAGEVLGWTVDQMVMDPDYIYGDEMFYEEALTTLAIQLKKIDEDFYDIHYNILPVGSLAGIGPCNY